MKHDDWILVGVDGSPASKAAVGYACREAQRRHTGVRLLHAVPPYPTYSVLYPMPNLVEEEQFQKTGTAILVISQRIAEEFLPADRIETVSVVGSPWSALLGASAHASPIVVGHDDVSLLERLSMGATAAAVAAQATVPVVSVPSNFGRAPLHGRIAVGLADFRATPVPLLRAAFEEAASRGAGLDIVHVWDLPPQYADIVVPELDFDDWMSTVDAAIRNSCVELRQEFPEVDVEVKAACGQVSDVLRDASWRADLLLLGRGGAHPTTHLGSTGRALLKMSACPVEVFPALGDTAAAHGPKASASQALEGGRAPDPGLSVPA